MFMVKSGLLIISLVGIVLTIYLLLYKDKINAKKENDEQIKKADFLFLITFSVMSGYVSQFVTDDKFLQLLPIPLIILFCHFLYRISNKKDDIIERN